MAVSAKGDRKSFNLFLSIERFARACAMSPRATSGQRKGSGDYRVFFLRAVDVASAAMRFVPAGQDVWTFIAEAIEAQVGGRFTWQERAYLHPERVRSVALEMFQMHGSAERSASALGLSVEEWGHLVTSLDLQKELDAAANLAGA